MEIMEKNRGCDSSPTLPIRPTPNTTHLSTTAIPEACPPTRHSPTPEDGRGPTWTWAPDPTDAKHHAPLHGHTGGVPSDKALSDTH
eukprot:scaffold17415_cov147-Isochrysis_galbana.AAC.7